MATRTRITRFLLWLAVLSLSSWWGGTIYQMLVIVPLWSAAPPESVRAFFLKTGYNDTTGNFFGPPFMLARGLPVLLLVIFGWHLRTHRKYFLIALICMLAGLIFTLAHIYPISAVLFTQAGGNHSAEEIRVMVRHWVLADRLRFAVMTVGFLALLCAVSRPFPASTA